MNIEKVIGHALKETPNWKNLSFNIIYRVAKDLRIIPSTLIQHVEETMANQCSEIHKSFIAKS